MRLCLTVLLGVLMLPAFAEEHPPVVVETFTSKFCPNCPAGEATLAKYAEGQNEFMVVLEHVDYWDNPANNQIDPLGNADFTQRQYDYSNRLGRRPGEVFTPQPILDGSISASPPLWMGWSGTLERAKQTNFKVKLKLTPNANGGLAVSLPANTPTNGLTLTLLAIEKSPDKPSLWQARAMTTAPVTGLDNAIAKPLVPQGGGTHLLVLLQEAGGGVVKGSGLVAR